MKYLLALAGVLCLLQTSNAQVNVEILDDDERKKLEALNAVASDTIPKTWHLGGTVKLNFGQTYLSNWAAGGQNAVSATSFASLFARYQKDKHRWENLAELAYGLLSQDGKPLIKTDDRIDITSKYSYQTSKPAWFYTGLLNFRTQFAPGYEIADGLEVGEPISDFLAPAFGIFSLGISYQPNDNFSMMLSPITTKANIVTIDRLAPEFGLDPGTNVRMEFGSFFRLSYTTDIAENVNWLTRIDLFSNYVENPQNVDVNWENLVTMKINSWLSASLIVQLIYDDDIVIGSTAPVLGEDGSVITPGTTGGPRLQVRQVAGLGLSVNI
jgi:hypothetical protein